MKELLALGMGILLLSAQNLVSDAVFAQVPPHPAGHAPAVAPGMRPPPIPTFMRSVTVSGSSKEQLSPDQAVLSMSLVSRDTSLNTAKSHNDALVERLVSISRNFNIPRQNVKTSNIYISPEYNYPKGKRELIGYVVSRQLQVTMDSLDIHEKLLSAIVDAKIDQVNGVDFRLSQPETHAMKLRVKAFENARAKAVALAEAAGARLGEVLVISTVGNSTHMIPPPMPLRAMAMEASADMSVAPSLPGMVELEESVTVSFALE